MTRFALLIVPLFLTAGCAGAADDNQRTRGAAAAPVASEIRLSRNGVSLTVPQGWQGRILFRDPSGSAGVIFQVANFELPPNEGFDAAPELQPGEEDPIKAMSGDDVLVSLTTDRAHGRPIDRPVRLVDLRFLADGAGRVPVGHALAEGSFCLGQRCLHVEADFGGGRPDPELAARVDELLSSLVVSTHDSAGIEMREPLPGSWQLIGQQLTEVVAPRQVIALASFPVRQSQPDSNCAPRTALDQMPADGALILLLEYPRPLEPFAADFPPRPSSFRLAKEEFANYECYGPGYVLRYNDQGRQLQAQVRQDAGGRLDRAAIAWASVRECPLTEPAGELRPLFLS